MTTTLFTSERAPCGRIVDGEHCQDQDEQCLVTDEMLYACGCRVLKREYHDGGVARRVRHHNGAVLVDEILGAE